MKIMQMLAWPIRYGCSKEMVSCVHSESVRVSAVKWEVWFREVKKLSVIEGWNRQNEKWKIEWSDIGAEGGACWGLWRRGKWCSAHITRFHHAEVGLDLVLKVNTWNTTVRCPNLCLEAIRMNTESHGEGLCSVKISSNGLGGTHCWF